MIAKIAEKRGTGLGKVALIANSPEAAKIGERDGESGRQRQ